MTIDIYNMILQYIYDTIFIQELYNICKLMKTFRINVNTLSLQE